MLTNGALPNLDSYLEELRQKKKEKIRKKARDYYHKHPHLRDNQRKWIQNKRRKLRENNPNYLGIKAREWKYGTTKEDIERKYAEQGGACKTCGIKMPLYGQSRKALNLDHNHKTGQIRDLLCPSCNLALGHVKDNIQTLENLVYYLKEHGS